jgi:hypothetical protein
MSLSFWFWFLESYTAAEFHLCWFTIEHKLVLEAQVESACTDRDFAITRMDGARDSR